MTYLLNNLGVITIALALLSLAGAAAYLLWEHLYGSTPLDSCHNGKAHSHSTDEAGNHFACKFDAEEVRRTANQKRPRVEPSPTPVDPKVAALLAAIQQSDVEKALRELSGEVPVSINGKTVTLKTRNSYHGNIELAMQYLEQFYASIGLKSTRHEYKVRGRKMYNLIVEFTGAVNPKKVLYLGAHLDSTAGWPWQSEDAAPGADDDGTGTVGMMEIAKALLKTKPDCTIRLCHFTGEEQGLYGSYAYSDYVSRIKDETVIGMIEMDMIGYCGRPGNRVDVHDDVDKNGSHKLVVLLTQNAAKYGLNLNVFDTHNHAVQDRSDHAGFSDHGYMAVLVSEEFTDEGFNPNYHTTGDRVASINFPYMVDVIRMVLAGTCELAGVK